MRPFVKEVLGKTYLFQGLSPEQIDHVASLLEHKETIAKDDYIIYQGGTGNNLNKKKVVGVEIFFEDTSLYVIEKGSVRMVRKLENGENRDLLKLGVGQIFGEMSFITGLPRTCSVIASEGIDCGENPKKIL